MDPLIVFIKYLHGHNLHNLHELINLSKEFYAERSQKFPLFYLAPNEIFILFNELFILILNVKILKFCLLLTTAFESRRHQSKADVSTFPLTPNQPPHKPPHRSWI